jgi:hypothetical protein
MRGGAAASSRDGEDRLVAHLKKGTTEWNQPL